MASKVCGRDLLNSYYAFGKKVSAIMIKAKNDRNRVPNGRKNGKRKVINFSLISSFLLFIILLINCHHSHFSDQENHNFDGFVFSQRWLPTKCTEYVEKNPRLNNECVLPDNYQYWAVHGLWPTRNNGSWGPYFCNKSAHFNIDNLKPIEAELRQYWPNIEKGKGLSSLWKHEWLKHGTCAMQAPQFSSEFDYFNISLSLREEYDLNRILALNKVKPSDNFGYDIVEIARIVKESFGKSPQVCCINERMFRKAYLSEIRLCFDKNLRLIDCRAPAPKAKKIGFSPPQPPTCPLNKLVLLPATAYIPPPEDEATKKKRQLQETREKLLFILQAIRFFM